MAEQMLGFVHEVPHPEHLVRCLWQDKIHLLFEWEFIRGESTCKNVIKCPAPNFEPLRYAYHVGIPFIQEVGIIESESKSCIELGKEWIATLYSK